MSKQIITVGPDGSLFGLDHKKKGLQLRKLGKASTRRETLIEWDEVAQLWFIRWADEDMGVWTDAEHLEPHGLDMSYVRAVVWKDPNDDVDYLSNILYFEDYEDAVECEVRVIQEMQVKGILTAA